MKKKKCCTWKQQLMTRQQQNSGHSHSIFSNSFSSQGSQCSRAGFSRAVLNRKNKSRIQLGSTLALCTYTRKVDPRRFDHYFSLRDNILFYVQPLCLYQIKIRKNIRIFRIHQSAANNKNQILFFVNIVTDGNKTNQAEEGRVGTGNSLNVHNQVKLTDKYE